MDEEKVKWGNKEVFIHHIDPNEEYVLVSYSSEKTGLFKVEVKDLDLKGKKLKAYLLVQVEKKKL